MKRLVPTAPFALAALLIVSLSGCAGDSADVDPSGASDGTSTSVTDTSTAGPDASDLQGEGDNGPAGNDVSSDPSSGDGGPDASDPGLPDEPEPGETCPTQTEVPPVTDFVEVTIGGTRVRWVGEDTGAGVLLLLHGTGGDVTTWFDRVAGPEIIRDALDRGLVVVAMESLDREPGAQWELGNPNSNPDVANVQAALQQLEDDGVFGADAAMFVVGGSNGGAFTSVIAQKVDFDGAVIFIARGTAFMHDGAKTPSKVVFIPGANDPDIPPSEVEPFAADVVDLGGESWVWPNEPAPLTKDVLSRLPGVSCAQSYALTQALTEGGILGEDGFFLVEPTPSMQADVPAAFADEAQIIVDQLMESHGGHMVTSEFNAAWLDLFLGE